MTASKSQGDHDLATLPRVEALFNEREARTILLVRALEEDADQTQIDREAFSEATRVVARGLRTPASEVDLSVWARDFLKPRSERLFQSLVADHHVYHHFVDTNDFRSVLIWSCFGLAAVLMFLFDYLVQFRHVEAVSVTLLVVLVFTWGTIAYSLLRSPSPAKPVPKSGALTRLAAWLSRLFHRLPGARPISPQIVTRFEDLWLQHAAPIFQARVRLAFQAIGVGVIVGALLGLFFAGYLRSVPIHWGTTWSDGPAFNHGLYRIINLPGRFAYEILGGKHLTRDEFNRLRVSAGEPRVSAEGVSVNADTVQAGHSMVAVAPDPSVLDRWRNVYALSLLVGALVPRVLFGLFLWRRERVVSRTVALDISDHYFRRLHRDTLMHERLIPKSDVPRPGRPGRKCWKPWTWFRRRPLG
jgi:hypothetical protein